MRNADQTMMKIFSRTNAPLFLTSIPIVGAILVVVAFVFVAPRFTERSLALAIERAESTGLTLQDVKTPNVPPTPEEKADIATAMDFGTIAKSQQLSAAIWSLFRYRGDSGPREIDSILDEDKEFVAQFADRVAPMIDVIADEFSKAPNSVSMPKIRRGYRTTSEHIQDRRGVARILMLNANSALQKRDREKLGEAISAFQTWNLTAGSDDYLVGDLIAEACESMERNVVLATLDADVWQADDIERLIRHYRQLEPYAARWQRSWNSELSGLLESVSGATNDFDASDAAMLQETFDFGGFYDGAQLKIAAIDRIRESVAAMDQGIENLGRRLEMLDDRVRQEASSISLIGRSLSNFLPSFRSFGNVYERRENQRRFLVTALSAKLYQLKFGNFPDTMEKLAEVGLTKSDWTTTIGQSFRMGREDDSLVVWGYAWESARGVPREVPEDLDAFLRKYGDASTQQTPVHFSDIACRIR